MLVRRLLFSCVIWLLSIAAFGPGASAAPQWVQQAVPGPSPRAEFGFAYDSGRGVSVLFGGSSNLTFTAVNRETWEWDGVQWTLRSTTGPAARCDNAFAYDSNRHRVVSFGGYNGAYFADTWEWDGATWTQVPGAGPTARADAFMAFDSIRNEMVLFGGLAPSGQVLNDTWVYNGVWTRKVVAVPTRRWIARMAFDRDRGKVVLFGGASSAGLLADTWEWDGTQWIQNIISGPAARYGNALCYDTDRHLTLLFGGQTGFDFGDGPLGDTWEYDGAAWSERAIPGPSPRTFVKMVYDAMRQRAVLFGGFDGNATLDDTWELVNDNPTPTAISLASADASEGRVTITWQVGGATPIAGTVLRSRAGADWAPVGTVRSDGSGRLRFVDTNVEPGRYGYQLELIGDAGRSDEMWVEVPGSLGFRLRGFDPNPTREELRVSFSLASHLPARIDVLDLAGRTILSRDVTDRTPGDHRISLGSSSRLGAGVYWIRLTQGDEWRAVRGVVVK